MLLSRKDLTVIDLISIPLPVRRGLACVLLGQGAEHSDVPLDLVTTCHLLQVLAHELVEALVHGPRDAARFRDGLLVHGQGNVQGWSPKRYYTGYVHTDALVHPNCDPILSLPASA